MKEYHVEGRKYWNKSNEKIWECSVQTAVFKQQHFIGFVVSIFLVRTKWDKGCEEEKDLKKKHLF